MRRSEFDTKEDEEFQFIVNTAEVGHLGIVDTNQYARIVPLNFIAIDKIIYFHGATEGEKYFLLQSSPKVTFSVDIPYSFIPSHFVSKQSGCPATHFFKSLHVRGQGKMVNDLEEKVAMFSAMLLKYQPEGKFKPFTSTDPIYKNPLMEVAVFKVIPDEITMKMKFGQNLNETKRNQVIEGLRKRNELRDQKTIKEMEKFNST